MASPIVGDTTISACREENHLIFPCVRTKGPPVAENHRLSCTPILVINLCAVFRCDGWHECLLGRCSQQTGKAAALFPLRWSPKPIGVLWGRAVAKKDARLQSLLKGHFTVTLIPALKIPPPFCQAWATM